MRANVHLVFISRFNVQLPAITKAHGVPPADEYGRWQQNRAEIFERFTYPAMQKQVDQNFLWIALFDRERTDQSLAKKIDQWRDWCCFVPYFLDEAFSFTAVQRALVETLRAREKSLPDVVATGWLDTDDVLSPNYSQIALSELDGTAGGICFPRGYRASLEYLERNGAEATTNGFRMNGPLVRKIFMSQHSTALIRVESFEGEQIPETVYRYPHAQLRHHVTVRDIRSEEYHFVKIVHEHAVLNTVERIFNRRGGPPIFAPKSEPTRLR